MERVLVTNEEADINVGTAGPPTRENAVVYDDAASVNTDDTEELPIGPTEPYLFANFDSNALSTAPATTAAASATPASAAPAAASAVSHPGDADAAAAGQPVFRRDDLPPKRPLLDRDYTTEEGTGRRHKTEKKRKGRKTKTEKKRKGRKTKTEKKRKGRKTKTEKRRGRKGRR